jgi:hypothetical protein
LKLLFLLFVLLGTVNAFAQYQNEVESPLISDVLKKTDVQLAFLKPLHLSGSTGDFKENFRLVVYKNTPLTCIASYRTSVISKDMLKIEPGHDADNKVGDIVPLWMDADFGSKDKVETTDEGTTEKIHLVISGPYAIGWVDCVEFSAMATSAFETVYDFEKATDGILTLR